MSVFYSLIRRGDHVSIDRGRLVITPKSGRPVPNDWYLANRDTLAREVAALVEMPVLRYLQYSTGQYGKGYSGVTLQFLDISSGENPYTVFNADLTRKRRSKNGIPGARLPAGQFRVGERSAFYKFWRRCDLQPPRRLSAWHDYMSKLKPILLTGELSEGRVIKETLEPITVTVQQIKAALLYNKSPTISGQDTDNFRTIVPDKDSPQAQSYQGLQRNQTKGASNYGHKVTSTHGYTESPAMHKSPQEQTHEEWLRDYSGD